MRPLRRGLPHLYADGQPYNTARQGLEIRIGSYCSYCERRLSHSKNVEHIQPKAIHVQLECIWANFLIACVNCNASKSCKNPPLGDWLIPDRDNTFLAFLYRKDGLIEVNASIPLLAQTRAKKTLEMVGLDTKIAQANGVPKPNVELMRRSERMQVWLEADRQLGAWQAQNSPALENAIIALAKQSDFFSIWMAAFEGEPAIRKKFIGAFPGTETGCFDVATTVPISPHPNSDNLCDGGKL